jgi:hypothetical protein
MQDSNQATRVSDRLLVPNDRFAFTPALIHGLISILLKAEFFIVFRDWEDEE